MMEQFITWMPKNVVHDFSGSDNAELFIRNREKLGKDWIYRNKKIEYRHNEQGFRADPFNSVDWKNSIVVLGCSNVQGVGQAEEDTLVMQLQTLMNIPVINLGVGGAGIDVACWNSTILHNFYPNPKAVVQIWSSLNRYADYKNGIIELFLPQLSGFYYGLNWECRSALYIKTDRALWQNKTVYSESSFFPDTARTTKTISLLWPDFARDLGHPGIQSNLEAAEQIAEDLQKKGL